MLTSGYVHTHGSQPAVRGRRLPSAVLCVLKHIEVDQIFELFLLRVVGRPEDEVDVVIDAHLEELEGDVRANTVASENAVLVFTQTTCGMRGSTTRQRMSRFDEGPEEEEGVGTFS